MPSIARIAALILAAAAPLSADANNPRHGNPPYLSHQWPQPGEAVPAAYQSPPSGAQPAGADLSRDGSAAAPAALPISPPEQRPPLPLCPPGQSGRTTQNRRLGGLPSAVTVAGSLAIVLGVFFLVAWGMRRAAPPGSTLLPGEVLEVLGRAPLAGRQQLHLLRCGKKLLLVSLTPAGAETLTEITDPLEVDHLAGLCRQAHPQSATAAFRQVFQQFAQPRPVPKPAAEQPDESGWPSTYEESQYRPAGLTHGGVPAAGSRLEKRDV